MKIIYYSSPFFADCDFPLLGELQRKGHDVRYYISIASFCKRSTLVDLKELYPHTGIYPASEIYKEFNDFRHILDLSHVYIVNQKHKQKFHPANLLLMIKLAIHFMMQKPDVIHLTKPPYLTQKLLYLVKKKLVLTVHDTFQHTGYTNKRAERDRRMAFKKISKLVLLNNKQSSSFASYYHVPNSHIFINKLGMYSSILYVDPIPFQIDRPFILFFGQIVEYKGVEYLLEAMKIVHSHYPELMLVIAGGGKYYFDIESYKKLDYVKIINHYIGTRELAGMLRACEFGVCPYKEATQSGVIQTAFTLEVPMVVTNVGALSESVHHNKTGIVVKPCDVNDLANGIMELHSDKEKLNAMRNNIKKEWMKDMGWEPIADDYLKCYEAKI
jgi:glycosyltransferase involved in cell wall biosynthesis